MSTNEAQSSLPLLRQPRQVSLSEQIYESLHHALLQGDFAPGTRIIESAIAEQLGVSRTPVREALYRLTVEGWFEVRRNKSVIVAGITPREVEERYALREILEGYAAREAAARMTDERIRRLEYLCDRAEECLDDSQAAEYAGLNDEFHMEILRAANNDALIVIWEQFLHTARHHVFTLGTKDHRQQFVQGHRELLEAIRIRDKDAADAAMRRHLHLAMKIYLSDTNSE